MRARSSSPEMGKVGKLQKKGGAVSKNWLLVASYLLCSRYPDVCHRSCPG